MEFHAWELFPRAGFIVTNLETDSRGVVRFYNKRGRAEQWIKEGKLAVSWTRLSCHRFQGNEVRLWLSVIAYNLGSLWRRLGLPRRTRRPTSHACHPNGARSQSRPALTREGGGRMVLRKDKKVEIGDSCEYAPFLVLLVPFPAVGDCRVPLRRFGGTAE